MSPFTDPVPVIIPSAALLSISCSSEKRPSAASTSGSSEYYRVALTAVASYDTTGTGGGGGGGGGAVAPGGTATRGTTVIVTITLPTTPPQPPANVVPISVTLAGTIVGTAISRPAVGTAQATFTIPANAPTGAQNVVVVFSPGPTYTLTSGLTIQ